MRISNMIKWIEDKILAATPATPATACRCVDCGGDQPGHDAHCAYMRDLHGAQPGKSTKR